MGKITFLEYEGHQDPELTFSDLLSDIDVSWGLMVVPATSFELPAKYAVMAQPRRKVRIEYNNWVFEGFIMGKETDNHKNTVVIDLTHVIVELSWHKLPTNLSIKAELIPTTLGRPEFQVTPYTTTFDAYAAVVDIDYVFSNQNLIEAYSQVCENTDSIFWRVNRQNPYIIEFGSFGEDTGIEISKDKYLISDVDIAEDFGESVVNYAVVIADKSDSGNTSVTLQDIIQDKSLQDPNFPVVLTGQTVNNEREYKYARAPQFASNSDMEYAIMDIDGLGMMEAAMCYGYFASNDLQPHSNVDNPQINDKASITVRESDKTESKTTRKTVTNGIIRTTITTTVTKNKTTGRVTTTVTTTQRNTVTGQSSTRTEKTVNVTGNKVSAPKKLKDHSKGLNTAVSQVVGKGKLVTEEYRQLQNNTYDEFIKYFQPIFNKAGYAGDAEYYITHQKKGTKPIPPDLVIQAVNDLKADPKSQYSKEQAIIASGGLDETGQTSTSTSDTTVVNGGTATTLYEHEDECRVMLQNNTVTAPHWQEILTALKNIVGYANTDLVLLTGHWINLATVGILNRDIWNNLIINGASGLQKYIRLDQNWTFNDSVDTGRINYENMYNALITATTTGIYAGGIGQATTNANNSLNGTPPAITNADRVQTAIVMYQRAIRKLKHSRPKIEYTLELESSFYDNRFNVGQKVHFDYTNTQVEQMPCGLYYQNLLALNDDFYIIAIQDNNTTVSITVAKNLYQQRSIS